MYMNWEALIIKEDLLYIFKKLLENDKITINEYDKAVKLVLEQYS